jgi:hypothetical protein
MTWLGAEASPSTLTSATSTPRVEALILHRPDDASRRIGIAPKES